MPRIPGPIEPDPENLRQRPFQGGTDGLPGPAAEPVRYGDVKYMDGGGPAAEVELQRGGAGSGLSGLPQANAGNVPARFNDPDTPPGDTQ